MENQEDWMLKKKRLEGKYANYFRIGCTDNVFVFDYYQIFPENDDEESTPRLFDNPKDRIIMSPSDAKQLLRQLKAAVEIYESGKKKFQG